MEEWGKIAGVDMRSSCILVYNKPKILDVSSTRKHFNLDLGFT